MLVKAKNICLYSILVIIASSNLINYFYAYKYLNDLTLQWSIAMYSISIVLFLFSLYFLLIEISKNRKTLKLILVGWMTLYLLINLIGVILGYTLHSKGFMAMMFSTIVLVITYIISKKQW